MELSRLLHQGFNDAILVISFIFQATRNEWKSLVERLGGRWVLVYLDVNAAELRRRVAVRNQLTVKGGNSAFLVTEDVLDICIAGFERPAGKGEIVLCMP